MKLHIKTLMVLAALSLPCFGGVEEGGMMPQLIFHSSSGNLVFLNDYVGEPRMLNAAAERVPLLLVFFRNDDPAVDQWMPPLVSGFRGTGCSAIFVAVDESSERVEALRKKLKVRAFFVIDKYGSSAEELGLMPSSRFSKAPTALLISRDGRIRSIFRDFQTADVDAILKACPTIVSD